MTNPSRDIKFILFQQHLISVQLRLFAIKMYIPSQFIVVLATVIPQVLSQSQQPIFRPQRTISQPLIGFGTWNLKISPENTTAVVSLAIETGYRQIDCAAIYGNQVAVGKGIKEGLQKVGLRREDIWVTSKLWNDQ